MITKSAETNWMDHDSVNGSIPNINTKNSSNALQVDDLAVHSWYRFVLSCPPHLVREYLERFDVSSGVLLDPFCGTGTTIVEAKKLGVRSMGVEASPMAYFASSTKTNWLVNPNALRRTARRVAETACKSLIDDGLVDDIRATNIKRARRKLDSDSMEILIKDSISPAPLHKVLVLVEVIKRVRDSAIRDLMLLAVARLLPCEIGNLRFGPEVGLGKIKMDVRVISAWLSCVESVSDDLDNLSDGASANVHQADARGMPNDILRKSIGGVFTSPPYPNEKDYTRTTRLESVVLGFYNNKQELRQFKQSLIRSNTRNVYVGDSDGNSVSHIASVSNLAQEIELRRLELGKTSGFEKNYAKVVAHYFGGMARHLESIKPKLRDGARLGYVVGDQASFFQVLIPTGQILAEIAESIGYRVESLDLFRTRLATATRSQLREEVLVLRWNGDVGGKLL